MKGTKRSPLGPAFPAWTVLIIILALQPAAGLTAEPPGRMLTLEECLKIALEKSPAVASADKTVEGAEWGKKKARSEFLPKLSAQYSYTRLDEEPKSSGYTLNIPGLPAVTIPSKKAGTLDNYQFTFSVTQPLFTGFALLSQYELAKLGLDAAEIGREQSKMDLALQVKQAYFGVLQALKSLEVAGKSVEQLEAHLKVARSFFDVGMVPKNQVLQAEVKLAEAVQKRTVAENQVRYTQAALNTLLRRGLEDPLQVQDILTFKPFTRTLDECTRLAISSRPEVKAAQKKIDMKGQEVRLAKSGYYPNVAVTYNHISKGDTWRVDGSSYNDNPNQWNVTAVATWNFWEWGKTYSSVQASHTEEAKAHNALTQVEDGVRLEVKQYYLNLEAAGKNIFVSEKAVEQAEENYRMSVERYREQVATSTEVTDAETLLTSARTNRYAVLYQYNLAWATLERAIGVNKL
ncbi:MAG: TolC family protein [Thermodesulfobacteriota bacterium]